MSDILIKGMKMPPKGEYTATIYVDSDGTAYIDFDSREMDEYTVYDGKCDLVEVPKHGRLIDADVLNELIDSGYDLDFDEVPETKIELMRMIDEAPTIIEGSET